MKWYMWVFITGMFCITTYCLTQLATESAQELNKTKAVQRDSSKFELTTSCVDGFHVAVFSYQKGYWGIKFTGDNWQTTEYINDAFDLFYINYDGPQEAVYHISLFITEEYARKFVDEYLYNYLSCLQFNTRARAAYDQIQANNIRKRKMIKDTILR